MLIDELFESILLGQEICIVNRLNQHPMPGQCERHGAVIDKVKNTRTSYLVVLFDDSERDFVGEIESQGLGAHLYPILN